MRRLLLIILGLAMFPCCVRSGQVALSTPEAFNNNEDSASNASKIVGLDICSVDFANFTYPWPDSKNKEVFSLSQGRYVPGAAATGKSPLLLSGVIFEDFTGDGLRDAAVVVDIQSGGSALPRLVYIYSLQPLSKIPTLLWGFETGDRAADGLRSIHGDAGLLIVETYNDFPNHGDCCPSTYRKATYRWSGHRFLLFEEKTIPNIENSANSHLSISTCISP